MKTGQPKNLNLDEELTHPGGGSFSFLPRGPVMIDLLLLLYPAMYVIVISFRSRSNHHAAPEVEPSVVSSYCVDFYRNAGAEYYSSSFRIFLGQKPAWKMPDFSSAVEEAP